ncbi:hypothetical protein [Cellulomonas sp. URHB0016]
MSDELKVDTTALREAGTLLRSITQELHTAGAHADRVADLVGHPGLAQCMQDFASSWDGRRARLVDEIGALATACGDISDQFEAIDTQFASALAGES